LQNKWIFDELPKQGNFDEVEAKAEAIEMEDIAELPTVNASESFYKSELKSFVIVPKLPNVETEVVAGNDRVLNR